MAKTIVTQEMRNKAKLLAKVNNMPYLKMLGLVKRRANRNVLQITGSVRAAKAYAMVEK